MPWVWIPDPPGTFSHRVELWIPETPMPHMRDRMAKAKDGRLFTFTPEQMTHYQGRIKTAFYQACERDNRVVDHPWLFGPVVAMTHFFFKAPKKYFDGMACELNKDVDNLQKNIFDALNCYKKIKLVKPDPLTGKWSKVLRQFGAWEDDKQVTLSVASKNYGVEFEGIWVTLDFYFRNEKPTRRNKK